MGKRIFKSVCYTLLLLIVVGGVMVIMYILLGIVELPVQDLQSPLQPTNIVTTCSTCTSNAIRVNIRLSFVLYLISIIAFFGTFLFVLFAGIGFAALPIDLFAEYKNRPKLLPLDEWANKKLQLGKMAEEVLEKGKGLADRYPVVANFRSRTAFNEFKKVSLCT